jgi:hypothetical protein
MFLKERDNFENNYPNFKISKCVYHTIFHYWMAGGYNLPPLMPKWSLGIIRFSEKLLKPFGNMLASFIYIILEKVE